MGGNQALVQTLMLQLGEGRARPGSHSESCPSIPCHLLSQHFRVTLIKTGQAGSLRGEMLTTGLMENKGYHFLVTHNSFPIFWGGGGCRE